ncbi:heparan sulfate glucosamine 3-O-sulfotransferase 5 isoform X2 [Octopus vulgaris]|uniref:Heparan sulfate glucosamine 3-O-sulfotransferase 5 isoform X2 n=1 Tax=Octopus vulgaris TaxID=6645 RepID=A0AA36BS10_OCTVU|nr:heparan sulfate glucosamine 3-O-sulfotransferase 5 isoform X2 [Octopus vulgaris]
MTISTKLYRNDLISRLRSMMNLRLRNVYILPTVILLCLLLGLFSHFSQVFPQGKLTPAYTNQKLMNCDARQRLPSCIIIGTPKSGTKALLEFIGVHPAVAVAEGEPKFFHRDDNYQKGMNYYVEKMPLSCPDQITMEKSPEYFYSDKAPFRIHKMNRTIKLILIVKNPVDRSISEYIHRRTHHSGKEAKHSFEEIVYDDKTQKLNVGYYPIAKSVYYRYLIRWLQYFPLNQIHVADGSKLIVDPQEELLKVQDFLGLKRLISRDNFIYNNTRGFYCLLINSESKCLPPNKGHRNVSTSKVIAKEMTKYFKPYNDMFFQLIKRNLSWT